MSSGGNDERYYFCVMHLFLFVQCAVDFFLPQIVFVSLEYFVFTAL